MREKMTVASMFYSPNAARQTRKAASDEHIAVPYTIPSRDYRRPECLNMRRSEGRGMKARSGEKMIEELAPHRQARTDGRSLQSREVSADGRKTKRCQKVRLDAVQIGATRHKFLNCLNVECLMLQYTPRPKPPPACHLPQPQLIHNPKRRPWCDGKLLGDHAGRHERPRDHQLDQLRQFR